MGKLHELLAVEGDLKSKAQHALAEAKGLFSSGAGKFVGQIRRYHPMDDGGERLPDESTRLATGVESELEDMIPAVSAWFDASVQKEVTNQSTSADLVVNGVTIAKGLPATALLNLEGKLAELKAVYMAVPITDPSEKWSKDPNLGFYVSDTRETRRTKKVTKPVVLYEATKEHPAQVQAIQEDVPVGTWLTTIHSGQISALDKAKMLNRVDELLIAVKSARQRANDIEVKDVHVGNAIFQYIHAE